MWVKAFRYFGWKKSQCGTRRYLCGVFLPLAPAPQSGQAAPAPVNGRFAGLLLMRLQPVQTAALEEIMSMKRGIVRGNGFPLLDKSQQPLRCLFSRQGHRPGDAGLWAPPELRAQGGRALCTCPRTVWRWLWAAGLAFSLQAHGQTFTFPDLFPEKQQGPDGSPGDEDLRDRLLEEQRRRQSRDPRRGGVPDWFGL